MSLRIQESTIFPISAACPVYSTEHPVSPQGRLDIPDEIHPVFHVEMIQPTSYVGETMELILAVVPSIVVIPAVLR